jgi:hypothetical protein
MKRYIFLCVSLSLYLSVDTTVLGQVIRGNVVSSVDGKPVPYVTIYSVKSFVGNHADEDGYFEWNIGNKQDSLVISSVGYEIKKIIMTSLKAKEINVIKLDQSVVSLNEVIVKRNGKAVEKEIGFSDNEPQKGMGMGPGGISENELYVNYYPNIDQNEGWIKKLKFDIRGFDFSQKNSKAKIRILGVNKSNGLPDNDLLQKDIIVKINRLSPDIILDIEKLNIQFPIDGLFIGLEFICNSEFVFKKQSLVGQKSNCPRITLTKSVDYKLEGKSYFWTFHRNKWQWVCVSDGSVFPNKNWIGLVFRFGATVLLYP